MSEKSNSPSTTPSNNEKTVQKKKSFRHKKSSSNLNRNKKSNSNLKVKPLEQMENDGKQKKVNSEKIPKNQVNKENNDNKKTEIEKKEVEKKKNRYNKKKSMSDLKKDVSKSDAVSEAKSDVTSSTNDKPDLKKSASKQFKKRKSKANLKEKINKTEEEQKEDDADKKLIDSFLISLSLKKTEMEKEEEEIINNPPQQNKFTNKRQSYTNKANKPKKELPVYDDVEIRKVLDCYDFPTSFKTHNLLEIFEEFRGKFRINWIDDSRALFIFENEDYARAALLSKIEETRYIIKPYENPNSDSSSSYSLNDPKISAIKILKNVL